MLIGKVIANGLNTLRLKSFSKRIFKMKVKTEGESSFCASPTCEGVIRIASKLKKMIGYKSFLKFAKRWQTDNVAKK